MKKQITKKDFISFKTFKKNLLKKPSFRKVWEEQSLERRIFHAIVSARVKKGLTQEQLAKKIGVAQPALARFEAGRTNPTLEFLKKVTNGLGLRLMVK